MFEQLAKVVPEQRLLGSRSRYGDFQVKPVLWGVPNRIPDMVALTEGVSMSIRIVLLLTVVVVVAVAEVFLSVVDVHKSFVSSCRWWGNGGFNLLRLAYYLHNYSSASVAVSWVG